MNSLQAAWIGVKAVFGMYEPEPELKNSPEYAQWKLNNQELAAAKERHEFTLKLVNKLMWIGGVLVVVYFFKKFKIF